ncbi:MAG: hypothetical protein AAGU76_06295 [Sedimentibacter sp.]|uniref:hypothetical protein n=1 Tax=Sedimentibacter sp. TaxID=1960295 RepID=UPI003158EDB5
MANPITMLTAMIGESIEYEKRITFLKASLLSMLMDIPIMEFSIADIIPDINLITSFSEGPGPKIEIITPLERKKKKVAINQMKTLNHGFCNIICPSLS